MSYPLRLIRLLLVRRPKFHVQVIDIAEDFITVTRFRDFGAILSLITVLTVCHHCNEAISRVPARLLTLLLVIWRCACFHSFIKFWLNISILLG
ncbi:MAG: hypothetical protein GPOALKHO_001204 [Sodalis sp.]|nr:MAG: hypothetical protein GPOALKHO_001204 [Sodalis sp.]